MSRIAFLYPGQGAQEVGMAGDFYEKSEEAKAVFDQASSILDFDVREICFQKNDLLDKTEYTQAAMVTACLAITRELEKRGLYPEMTAGLSLGEYCAIAAAGSMSRYGCGPHCPRQRDIYGTCGSGRNRGYGRCSWNGRRSGGKNCS